MSKVPVAVMTNFHFGNISSIKMFEKNPYTDMNSINLNNWIHEKFGSDATISDINFCDDGHLIIIVDMEDMVKYIEVNVGLIVDETCVEIGYSD